MELPFEAGTVKVTFAEAGPGVTDVIFGAPGTAQVVIALLEGFEVVDNSIELVAVTVNL
jgi:hypothetical protein